MCGSVFVFDRGLGSNRSNQNEDKISLEGGKEERRELIWCKNRWKERMRDCSFRGSDTCLNVAAGLVFAA